MSRTLSSRGRALLALAVAVVAFAAVPSLASAGQVDWELRSSWLTYVTRWGGRTVATSPATYSAPYVTSPQVGTGSGSVAAFDGGFNSTIALHGVDVKIEDLSIDYTTGNVVGSGHYKPLLSSVVPFSRWHLFTLASGTKSTGTNPKTWYGAIPALTANGARVFNGGANGSYAAGQPFGALDAVGAF